MADLNLTPKLGWLPDWPDFRDKTEEDDQIGETMGMAGYLTNIY